MGTMMAMAESKISISPGLNIRLSMCTSLVARAMMSPMRCRPWKVWLLPSRLT
jgi:hypothetical protein